MRGEGRGGELVGLLLDGRAVLGGVAVKQQVPDLVCDGEPVLEHVLGPPWCRDDDGAVDDHDGEGVDRVD